MSDNEKKIFYLLYPRDYDKSEKIIQGIDYDKLIGYVFKKIHETKYGDKTTIYFRSIYPNTDQMLTVDKEYFEEGKSGLKYAMSKEDGCVLQDIQDEGTDTLPECKWYGLDGCCFLHGAGCSPMYRQYGALRKWGIPLDEEREQEHDPAVDGSLEDWTAGEESKFE